MRQIDVNGRVLLSLGTTSLVHVAHHQFAGRDYNNPVWRFEPLDRSETDDT